MVLLRRVERRRIGCNQWHSSGLLDLIDRHANRLMVNDEVVSSYMRLESDQNRASEQVSSAGCMQRRL